VFGKTVTKVVTFKENDSSTLRDRGKLRTVVRFKGGGGQSVAEDACAVLLLTVKDADINKQNDQLIRDQPTNQH
jgi:hypothetical protein